MTRRWRRLYLVLFGVGAGLVVAELAVRICYPQPQSWMAIYGPHPTQPMIAVEANIDESADTGETRWRVRTDQHGLRLRSDGRRLGVGPPILLLGDSFTFGYGVDAELSFAGILEARLAPRAQVINAGQPAYGPLQEHMLLQYLLGVGIEPRDVVLVVYAGNDVLDAILPTERPVIDRSIEGPPSLRLRIRNHSHLYRALARVYHRWCRRTPHFVHDWRDLMIEDTWTRPDVVTGMQRMRTALTELRDLCRARGLRLHVAVLPPAAAVDALGDKLARRDPALHYELPVQRMMSLLQDLEVPALDLTPALAPLGSVRAFLPFDGHLSPDGNAAIADALQIAVAGLRS